MASVWHVYGIRPDTGCAALGYAKHLHQGPRQHGRGDKQTRATKTVSAKVPQPAPACVQCCADGPKGIGEEVIRHRGGTEAVFGFAAKEDVKIST